MIHELDSSLRTMLEQELHFQNVTVSFDTPGDGYGPSNPTVNLFLYDVRENRELRDVHWRVERENGTAKKIRPPVRVVCSYLVTTWVRAPGSVEGEQEDIEGQHRLLGEAMRVLLRYTTLPTELLQGSLHDQEPPLPTTALQPGHLQSMGEFWQALGGKPKAALNYSVTINVPVDEPVELGPVVTDASVFRHGTEGDER